MKMLLALALIGLAAPVSFAAGPAPRVAAPATCAATPLMKALATLGDGATVRVRQTPGSVVVEDRVRQRVLLVATCDGLSQPGPADARRVADAQTATEVVRAPAGEVAYSHSATPLGTRVTMVAPSATQRAGLDVTAFDNDDVYVADAFGRLLYQRHTAADGTLVEREAAAVGCGCERVTTPDGVVTVTPR
ncbi:MAG: hypothetical protein CVU56_16360 [Deltaproteobacteria bacterium HGW-Deltaproteobacteria-14]|jgi:hypothetical protein|nr:MAG: hypothetical protein CVU56_16360 [Deltaproteobacteria bacterium HGW-Deltaproteobacteria-14]